MTKISLGTVCSSCAVFSNGWLVIIVVALRQPFDGRTVICNKRIVTWHRDVVRGHNPSRSIKNEHGRPPIAVIVFHRNAVLLLFLVKLLIKIQGLSHTILQV